VKKSLGCALVVIVLVVVVLGIAVAGSYNRLVGLQEGVETAWGEVENQYQRRADLVPNLVATVKGAADFEQETFTQVTEARARVGQVQLTGLPDAQQLERFQQAQGELSSALSRLLVVVERYPELTATQAFRDLQVQLEGTENRIAVARGRYNEAAQAYNTTRRRFPAVLVAGLMGFDQRPYFEAQEGAEEVPRVDFRE
jgi:LemA protein